MPPGTSRTEGRALSNCVHPCSTEAKTANDKLIFTTSCNYLHIRKNPLLDDVLMATFGVQLTSRHKKTSHHIDKQ